LSEPHARDAFIRANAKVTRPPIVPEIELYLASEVVPLWNKTEEIGTANLPPPYWAFAWPGGQALARYLLDHPETVKGRRVLDFGAGSGLVAIAAAKAGAFATAADIDPLSIAAIALNAGLNRVTVATIEDDVIGRPSAWDAVLLGDMCYERPLAERLLEWLEVLARQGTEVLLGDPGRSYFPPSGMARLATYSVPTTRDLEDREVRATSVYRLLPRGQTEEGVARR
jgi:predicted nicotinamide N-methyase